MTNFTYEKLSPSTTKIQDVTGVSCFLIQGSQEAVLIDTGTGVGGLKSAIDSLTDLPLTVILTHGHCDHAGGSSAFEKVYLSPNDFPLEKVHNTLENRQGYAFFSLGQNTKLSDLDFLPPRTESYIALHDRQIFDLGGITIEAIAIPGHTQGTFTILVQEERAMLFGDACNQNTFVFDKFSSSIADYKKSLLKLKTFDHAYDTVYFSHGPGIGPKQCLDDNIDLCDLILERKDDRLPFEFLGTKALRAATIDENFKRLDGKFGNIIYNKNNLN